MTTPVDGKPLVQPVLAPKVETTKERLARMRANSKTLKPEQIKEYMQVKKEEKK